MLDFYHIKTLVELREYHAKHPYEYIYLDGLKSIDKGEQLKIVAELLSYGFRYSLLELATLEKILNSYQISEIHKETVQLFLDAVAYEHPRGDADKKIQIKLFEATLNKGAKIELLFTGSKTLSLASLNNLQSLLLNEETAQLFLDAVLNENKYLHENAADRKNTQSKLIEAALNKGAKINTQNIRYDNDFLKALLDIQDKLFDPKFTNLDPQEFLVNFLDRSSRYISEEVQIELIDLCIKHKANIEEIIIKYTTSYRVADHLIDNVLSKETASIWCVARNNNQCIEKLALQGVNLKINANSLEYLIAFVQLFSFDKCMNMLKLFSLDFKDTHSILVAEGLSHSEINATFNFIKLTQDYINLSSDEKQKTLSDVEMTLLDKNLPCLEFNQYKNAALLNDYGYNVVHLAIISEQYNLAMQLLQDGHPIDNTALRILSGKSYIDSTQDFFKLANYVISNSTDLDILLNERGETIIDSIIGNPQLFDLVLEKSNDKLFTFLKQNKDCHTLELDSTKTNIAITHTEEDWSTGLSGTARKAMLSYPDLQFYSISLQDIEDCGSALLNNIDAFMNPGANDNFPKEKGSFSIQDVPTDNDPEKTYQAILSLADEQNIPYFGVCAGAQHLTLYSNGSLYSLSGYNHGQHTINILPGSTIHFMSLTKPEQHEAIDNCVFPNITYKGTTAHHFAANLDGLGNGIEIGGISEDNVAMAYSHTNGIKFATQYHAEIFYHDTEELNRQKILLDNFFDLATMHHDHRLDKTQPHPTIYMQEVQGKLSQCIEHNKCESDYDS